MRLKILIVEDQAIVALDLKGILEELNYEVCGMAINYNEAIEIFKTTNPDLVLLDINLNQEKSGIDVAESIKKLKNIPHLFVSANNDESMLEKVKSTQPYGFISKPFQLKDIRSAIQIAYNQFLFEENLIENEAKLKKLNVNLEEKIEERMKESVLLIQHLHDEINLRNKIEDELIDKEVLLKEIFNSVTSAMVLVDEKYNIITSNPAFIEIFEIDKNTPKNLLDFFTQNNMLAERDFKKIRTSKELEKKVKIRDNHKWLHFNTSLSKTSNSKIFNIIFSITDLTQQKQAEEILQKERESKIKSFIQGEENERKRISKELHDGLGQKLTAIKLNIAALGRQTHLDIELNEIIVATKNLIEETITETREISHNLSSSILNDYGLSNSLQKLVQDLKNTCTSNINITIQMNFPRLDINLETNLYRIIQEALNNSIKHAYAKNIWLHLHIKNELIAVCIEDDGIGFYLDKNQSKGKGLNNMSERCNLIGANYDIKSNQNKGTKICIELKNEQTL